MNFLLSSIIAAFLIFAPTATPSQPDLLRFYTRIQTQDTILWVWQVPDIGTVDKVVFPGNCVPTKGGIAVIFNGNDTVSYLETATVGLDQTTIEIKYNPRDYRLIGPWLLFDFPGGLGVNDAWTKQKALVWTDENPNPYVTLIPQCSQHSLWLSAISP